MRKQTDLDEQDAEPVYEVVEDGDETPASIREVVPSNEAGPFGPIYTQFHHNAQGAIAYLREQRTGEAVAALHHPDVGDIDIVWGERGTAEKDFEDGFGLAKIVEKHPAVLEDLQGFVESLPVKSRSNNRIVLSDGEGRVNVRLDWDGQAKKWLMAALKEEPTSDRTRTGAAVKTAEARSRQEVGDVDSTTSAEIKPVTEARSKPSKATGDNTGDTTPAKLDDFGEKLEGARKDMPPSLKEELSDDQIASQPLSKIWPADAHESIEDDTAAALTFAARAEIPAKPRAAHKVRRWVEKVKSLRDVVRHPDDARRLIEKGESDGRLSRLGGFFAKVRLLVQLPRETWKRVEDAGEYPAAIRYVDGKREAAPFSSVSIDGKTHRFDVGKIGPDEVQKIRELLGAAAPTKGGLTAKDFEIRAPRTGGSAFINRKGDSEYRALKTFTGDDAAKQARAWLNDNVAEAEAAWEAVKARDNIAMGDERRDENRERTGQNRRNGKDVTPEMFDKAFGFRGTQFGNWVSQGKGAKDRQGMLNDAYDALLDLSELLGIPSRAISLNGTLGLAFGARGKGMAGAHFEPSNLVINLTKTRGAGSLAHEWFHALDNYFSRMRRGGKEHPMGTNQDDYRRNNFITYRPEPVWTNERQGKYGQVRDTATSAQLRQGLQSSGQWVDGNTLEENAKAAGWSRDAATPEGVRVQVEAAFAELTKALNASPMAGRASAMSKGNSEGYWNQIIERGARSFENYILSKMAQRGWSNDFLANIRDWEDWQTTGKNAERYPYLKPEEEAPVIEAFDALFETIESRTDPATGNVVLFSRENASTDPIENPLSVQEVEEAIAGIRLSSRAGLARNGVTIVVVPDYSGFPPNEDGSPHAFTAGYIPGTSTIAIVAMRVRNARSARKALLHEMVGHFGLNLFPPAVKQDILDRINRTRDGKALSGVWKEIKELYADKSEIEQAEEVFARIAENTPSGLRLWWDRFLAHVLTPALRKLGLVGPITKSELRVLAAEIARGIREGKQQRTAADGSMLEQRVFHDDTEVRALVAQYANVDGAPTEAEIREAIKQYRDTERAYAGKPAYDKAKAAGRTKLTYGQWVQVRTPNFKRWFGDWEALRAQDRLDAMKSVTVRVPDGWRGLSEGEMRAKMAETLDALVQRKAVIQHPELGEIKVGRRGAKKTETSSKDPADMLVANDLEAALPQSIYARTESSSEQGVSGYTRLLLPVRIDGKELVAILTIRLQTDGDWYYNTVTVQDAGKEKRPGSYASPGADGPLGQTPITGLADFVRRPLTRVNSAEVSKVVDTETGEPLVVYHGTGADFDTFKVDTDRSLGAHFGTAAAASEIYASSQRGGNPATMAVFISSTKPIDLPDMEFWEPNEVAAAIKAVDPSIRFEESKFLGSTFVRTAAIIQALKAHGYTGVRYVNQHEDKGSTSFIAFDPSQIKSATVNIGTFNGNTGDIRFSFADPQAETTDTPELSAARPAHASALSAAVNAVTRTWGDNAPRVRVLASAEELPADAKRKEPIRYRDAEGYYDGETVYLVAPNLRSPAHALRTLAHEAVGHYGVDRIVDEFAARDGGMDKLVTDITRLRREGIGSPALRAVLAEVARRYPGASEREFAREVIAVSAERNLRNGLIGRAIAAIRAWARQLFPGIRFSEGDLRAMLVRSARYLRAGQSVSARQPVANALAFRLAPPTDTPAFRKFFGNSKVVDGAAAPLVVYHGTADGFTVFEDAKLGASTGHMSAPLGHFFAESKPKAVAYAKKAADGVPADERVIAAYLSIQNPKNMTVDELLAIDSQAEARALKAKLRADGFDGIHLQDVGQWIAFESGQIKSVDNRGTFDRTNPDINFSKAAEQAPLYVVRIGLQSDRVQSGSTKETLGQPECRSACAYPQPRDFFRPAHDLAHNLQCIPSVLQEISCTGSHRWPIGRRHASVARFAAAPAPVTAT